MKYIITESQFKFLSEQDSRFSYDKEAEKMVGDIVKKLTKIFSSSNINYDEEGYGIESGKFKWFVRRFEYFVVNLADNIYTVQIGEYDWLIKEETKQKFIDYILIYTLMNFFEEVSDEETEGEDFRRDGKYEGWLYFVRDIYKNELGKFYEEMKEMN
jgi:hypothetical protein